MLLPTLRGSFPGVALALCPMRAPCRALAAGHLGPRVCAGVTLWKLGVEGERLRWQPNFGVVCTYHLYAQSSLYIPLLARFHGNLYPSLGLHRLYDGQSVVPGLLIL